MILALSVLVAVVFGAGMSLMLSHDLFRAVAGAVLASNGMILFILLCSRTPPVWETTALDARVAADPLMQALALTATVITFGTTSFLLALAIRVHATHETVDLEDLARAEEKEEAELEREREEV